MTANVGIAERAERLVAILVATGLDGLGVPYIQAAALWLLAVGQHGDDRPAGARRAPPGARRDACADVRERADLPAVRRRLGASSGGCPSGWPTGCSTWSPTSSWRRRPAAVLRLEANLRRARPDGRRRPSCGR